MINVEDFNVGNESSSSATLDEGTDENFDTPELISAQNAALQYSVIAVNAILDVRYSLLALKRPNIIYSWFYTNCGSI